ncbi:DUF3800 domain-containing protein [Patescibacteria group bacterium]|nr:DUF3800 domain-containing protein [Patescibacteria group bacterium]
MKFIFIDETGHPKMARKTNLEEEPFFGITSVIVDLDKLPYFEREINKHKIECIEGGTERTVIHLEDITRNRKTFNFLRDKDKKTKYLEDLNILLKKLDFKTISILINKKKLLDNYGRYAYHPLVISYHYLFERIQKENEKNGTLSIVFLERFEVKSTGFYQHTEMSYPEFLASIPEAYPTISSVHLIDKKENLSGLQIADLCATPTKRYIQGLKEIGINTDFLKEKCAKSNSGKILGYGIKVFP